MSNLKLERDHYDPLFTSLPVMSENFSLDTVKTSKSNGFED